MALLSSSYKNCSLVACTELKFLKSSPIDYLKYYRRNTLISWKLPILYSISNLRVILALQVKLLNFFSCDFSKIKIIYSFERYTFIDLAHDVYSIIVQQSCHLLYCFGRNRNICCIVAHFNYSYFIVIREAKTNDHFRLDNHIFVRTIKLISNSI